MCGNPRKIQVGTTLTQEESVTTCGKKYDMLKYETQKFKDICLFLFFSVGYAGLSSDFPQVRKCTLSNFATQSTGFTHFHMF